MRLPLIYYANPILRKKSVKVEEINDDLRKLVLDMHDTLIQNNGIGLAAPQVGRNIRLFIIKVPMPSEENPEEWIEGNFYTFINPILSNPSKEVWEYDEGCLSIPKLYGTVTRPYRITVEATDIEGNVFKREFVGLEARCIMHENDHINGVLFIDRLEQKERKLFEPDLKRIDEKYNHSPNCST